jgi:hypothetical protein
MHQQNYYQNLKNNFNLFMQILIFLKLHPATTLLTILLLFYLYDIHLTNRRKKIILDFLWLIYTIIRQNTLSTNRKIFKSK